MRTCPRFSRKDFCKEVYMIKSEQDPEALLESLEEQYQINQRRKKIGCWYYFFCLCCC
jgi:hypothetical protein